MNVIPGPVRVVCVKCPANAVVLFQRVLPKEDGMLMLVECHGEQTFAYLSGETMMAKRDHPIIMQGLRSLTPEEAQERRDTAEGEMLTAAAWVEMLDVFLARPRTPPGASS